ncbi:MAG: outer membrane protein assembly factor BamA [Nitrospinota bacterium]|nr:outer membrane protein assembly factor BamA [Nitrospinota bacterium]
MLAPGSKYCIFALLLAALCSTSAQAFDASSPIKEVRIEGTTRADQNTVRYYLQTQPGQKYDRSRISSDIRKIHSLGYFDEIKVDIRETDGGLIATFVLKEKPFVKEIIITGAKEVEEPVVLLKLRTKKASFFMKEYLPWDQQRIKTLYRDKGYYFTEVESAIHKLENNQVNVEHVIKEGKKINVGLVGFRGNHKFPDHKLREVVSTKAITWTSLVTSGGSFKRDALKNDRLLLEAFYNEHGYIQVSVGEPKVEIDREKRKIYVYFPISEGEQYLTGDIQFEGDSVFTGEELRKLIVVKQGDVFNQKRFREDIFKINDKYAQKGYAFANVNPRFKVNREMKTVDVTLSPMKGDKIYLGRIEISGNESTRDRVIRREFLVGEGELFNSEKLRLSFQRINGLGFFEKVDFEQRSRGDKDLVDLEVKVEERETGQFSFALGYSSEEYLTVTGTLKWTNLLGKGQSLSVSVDTSTKREDYQFSFTEPAIFDQRFSSGFSLYNHTYAYQTYTDQRMGGSVTLGRGVGDFTWMKVGYKFEEIMIDINTTVEDGVEPSQYLKDQEGKRVVGAIFPSITYNTKDDPYSPASGHRIYAYLEYAGIGGDQKYIKEIGEFTQYQPLMSEFVGMFHAKAGYIEAYGGVPLSVSEKFLMGGARDLRGFNLKEVGPQDENGEVIGGEALLLFNFELQYRFTRYFRGFGFYDRGNLYGKDDAKGNTTDKLFDLENMRQSWGFGIHFFSPMGPISLIYGFKLDKREGESADEFHFTIGGEF